MAFRFFTIRLSSHGDAETELNAFLASNRILSVDRRFVEDGANSVWAFCVDYIPRNDSQRVVAAGLKKGRIDYREVLTPDEFAVFVRLRELRQKIAKEESIPVYAIFTNEQLSAMVKNNVRTLGQLGLITGVGDSRVSKYGDRFLLKLTEPNDASSEPSI